MTDESENDSDSEEYTLVFYDSGSDVQTVINQEGIIEDTSNSLTACENADDQSKMILDGSRIFEINDSTNDPILISDISNDVLLQENDSNVFNRRESFENRSNDHLKDDSCASIDFGELEKSLDVLEVNEEKTSIDFSFDSELDKIIMEEEEQEEEEEEEEKQEEEQEEKGDNLKKQNDLVEVGKRLDKLASILFENSNELRFENFENMLYYLNTKDVINIMNMEGKGSSGSDKFTEKIEKDFFSDLSIERVDEENTKNEQEELLEYFDALDINESNIDEREEKFVELTNDNILVDMKEIHAKKLAKLLDSTRYKSEVEVNEILKKINEQKMKIENLKNESLKDLAIEFNRFEELLTEQKAIAEIEDYELIDVNTKLDVDELEENIVENQRSVSPFIEMPLTKNEVTENYRIKVMEKDFKDRMIDLKKRLPESSEILNEGDTVSHNVNLETVKVDEKIVLDKTIPIEIEKIIVNESDEKSLIEFINENLIDNIINCKLDSMINEKALIDVSSDTSKSNVDYPDNDITLIIKKEDTSTDYDENHETDIAKVTTLDHEYKKESIDANQNDIDNNDDIIKTNVTCNNISEDIVQVEIIDDLSSSNENSQGPMDDKTIDKVDSNESLFAYLKEKENRPYIKGKVYDYDEKKHGVRMTEQFIKKHCKEHKLYQTPWLNDVLYLHYKGFSFIENLEKYTGLKTLWLENNGIREIANLENQSELRCLYLHHNIISKIENLEYLTKLDTLNLSYNMITKIENLDSLKFLNTLNLSYNYLQSSTDIEHLRLLEYLSILDISHNRIDTFDIVDILGDMKSLRVITLTGNPVLKNIKMYRKTMILKCKNLHYLDDRPVFPRDRACAEAW
ncbi:gelsolin-related protein of 125 kDa [Vespa crabro]|uniref:gelsolin-related protein of 125 kDa n=1 Tax=Vespa crabro TaxID=7445 RepID=UPI001F0198D6|nr:gelsolin-related protein of 125 kDa [Vespa crabro]